MMTTIFLCLSISLYVYVIVNILLLYFEAGLGCACVRLSAQVMYAGVCVVFDTKVIHLLIYIYILMYI